MSLDKPHWPDDTSTNSMQRVADRISALERELNKFADELSHEVIDAPMRRLINLTLLLSKEARRISEWVA